MPIAEREYESDADVFVDDVEPEAREAWEHRRAAELEYQADLEDLRRMANDPS